MKALPEDIKVRLDLVYIQFKQKYNIQHDDFVDFVLDIMLILEDLEGTE